MLASTTLLDGLDPPLNEEQYQACLATEGAVAVIAGAGSGKTRTLTARIAHLIADRGVDPGRILALTFTNKAAAEMRERGELLLGPRAAGVWLMTFHAACARILRREVGAIGLPNDFTILDATDSERLLRDIARDLFEGEDKVSQLGVRSLRQVISNAKNALVGPGGFADYAANQDLDEELAAAAAKVYPEYQRLLVARAALDFDDLLMLSANLLRRHPAIRERWHDFFHYILVDEYQDTNGAQYQVLSALSGNGNICVVGDPQQSIYGWRGADPENLTRFFDDYPTAQTIALPRNYRSTQRILDLANSLIAHNRSSLLGLELLSDGTGGDPAELLVCPDDRSEAEAVTARIARELRSGRPAEQLAILYRANWQARALEEALRAAGVSYRVVGGMRFYDRSEVRDLIAYARLAQRPDDELALVRIINTPRRGIGEAAQAALLGWARTQQISLREALRSASTESGPSLSAPARRGCADLSRLLDRLTQLAKSDDDVGAEAVLRAAIEETNYRDHLRQSDAQAGDERLAIVEEILASARLSDRRPDASLAALPGSEGAGPGGAEVSELGPLARYLTEVALVSSLDQTDTTSSITLSTLHAAKGLEWDSVYLVGLEEGVLPSLQDETRLEEERRLCYVGITRARKRLTLSYAQERFRYGERQAQERSRFLTEIPLDALEIDYIKPKPRQGAKGASRRSDAGGSARTRRGSTGGHARRTKESRSNPSGIAQSSPDHRPLKPAAPQPRTTPIESFRVGDQITHQKLGPGVVRSLNLERRELTCDFRGRSAVRLLLDWAPIERLDP